MRKPNSWPAVLVTSRATRLFLVLLGGRRVAVHGRRVRVDLRGRPRGRVILVARGRTRGGSPYRVTRVYHPCTAKEPA